MEKGGPRGSGVRDWLRGTERRAWHPAPGGPGGPVGRSGADTTPFPGDQSLRLTASPGGGRTHPGGKDGRFGGPDTNQAVLGPVTDPHTGTEQRTEVHSISLPGRPFSPPTPFPCGPHARLFSLGTLEVFSSRWFADLDSRSPGSALWPKPALAFRPAAAPPVG